MMQEMLRRLRDAGVADQMPASLKQLLERDDTGLLRAAEALVNSSKMNDETFVAACFAMSPDELAATNDPAIRMMNDLYAFYLQIREKNKEREGRLSQLYGQLITEKRDFLKTGFVPDANGTLRLTYGRVESYSPEDAVVKTPVTTLKGMLDKVTGVDPFIAPPRIAELHGARDFGRYVHPTLNDVPVALLYSTDSTGGNSGSPILNSRGELVGVNFDRAFEATINDFAWNHDYSRSIGVDIRYVLWLTEKVYGAANLIEEMGIR
jgi:hypothetical protein